MGSRLSCAASNDTQKQNRSKGCPIPAAPLFLTCFDLAAEAFGWKSRNPAMPGRRSAMAIGWLAGDAPLPPIRRRWRGGDAPGVRVFFRWPRAGRDCRAMEIGNGALYGRGADRFRAAWHTCRQGLGCPRRQRSTARSGGGRLDLDGKAFAPVVAQACDSSRMRLGQDGKAGLRCYRGYESTECMGALEEYAGVRCCMAWPKTASRLCIRARRCLSGGARLKELDPIRVRRAVC